VNEFESVSSAQIDRLVDGEMSSNERRSVLMSLDHDGGGWRRLALAFLESQALRDEFRRSRQRTEAATSAAANTVAVTLSPRSRLLNRRLAWAAMMSAGCLLAFTIGWVSRPPVTIVQSVSPSAERPSPEAYPPWNPPASRDGMLVNASGTDGVHQTLRLELGDGRGGPPQAVEVPVIENSEVDLDDLLNGPSVIPEDVQRRLLSSGRRVYEQRQLYEVTLEDGRRGFVPVSDVLVESVGQDVYQ
jgi:hypothetical protein